VGAPKELRGFEHEHQIGREAGNGRTEWPGWHAVWRAGSVIDYAGMRSLAVYVAERVGFEWRCNMSWL